MFQKYASLDKKNLSKNQASHALLPSHSSHLKFTKYQRNYNL